LRGVLAGGQLEDIEHGASHVTYSSGQKAWRLFILLKAKCWENAERDAKG